MTFDFSINNSFANSYIWNSDNKLHLKISLTCTKNTDFMALVKQVPTVSDSSIGISDNTDSSSSYSSKLTINLSASSYTTFSLSYVVSNKTADSSTKIESFASKLPSFNCSALVESNQ